MKDETVIHNVFVMDTLDNTVNIFVNYEILRIPLTDIIRIAFPQIAIVTLYDGKSIRGDFITSTDSSVIYETEHGRVVIDKKNIFSITNISETKMPTIRDDSRNRQIDESVSTNYESLPLLIITIAAGVFAGICFNDAINYSNTADFLSKLELTDAANEAHRKSDENWVLGMGASVVAIISFLVAVEPTESYKEQQLSVVPTQ